MPNDLRQALTVCTMLCVLAPAWAAKTLEVRDGETVITPISIRDQTRVRVDRGRIKDVLGDIYNAQANPTGRIVLVQDVEAGEIYIKPVAQPLPMMPSADTDGGATVPMGAMAVANQAPVKLDIKTDRGTFALLVKPIDTVGDTLVLSPRGAPVAEASATGKSAQHVRAVKALVLAMANPAYAGEAPAKPANNEVALWREARFILKSTHQAVGMVGEAYELTNVSPARMVIDERELYRPGVYAISVKRLSLLPGESTPVWIVRASGAN